MKRFVVILACITLLVTMVGCSGKASGGSESSATAEPISESSTTDENSAASAAATSESNVSSETSSSKAAKDGFNPETNYTITVAGVEFQIPDYYKKGEPTTSEKGVTTTRYGAESTSNAAVTILSMEQSGSGVTVEDFDKAKDRLTEAFVALNSDIVNPVVTDKSDQKIAGYSGRLFSVAGSYKGFAVTEHGFFYFNDNLSSIGCLVYLEVGNPEYDYSSDWEKTIASAQQAELTDEASGGATTDEGQTEQNPSGEVSPDLKEMLDSYEAFMDEYVEFMNSYQESGDTMSMLSQYTEYMQKYSDLMQKIEAVDTSNMSAADYAYYIEVTSRVSKKLLEVSGY